MRLIVVRHGETLENREGVINGHGPGSLTEGGREQVKKLALRLKDEEINVIFSSDLQRAKETTEEIAKFHQAPVYYTPELREMNWGNLEGKPLENFRVFTGENGSINPEFRPEGGENFRELKERSQKFLNKLLREYRYEDKTVLISSHGALIRMLLGTLLKKPIEEAIHFKVSNACVNVIKVGENSEIKSKKINCTSHL